MSVRLIAHRGVSARAPENTLPALLAAVEEGADGVEFDVRLTRDGVPVLMHDDDVAGTTDGRGRVSEMTLQAVRALEPKGRVDRSTDIRIPTLEEALEVVAGRIPIVVELKGVPDEGGFPGSTPVAARVLPVVEAVRDVVVSSFDPLALAYVRERAPKVATGLTIFLPPTDRGWVVPALVDGGHVECHAAHHFIDEPFVRAVHDAGKAVLAWIVNEPGRLRALAAMGVDGVFTDDPTAARSVLHPA